MNWSSWILQTVVLIFFLSCSHAPHSSRNAVANKNQETSNLQDPHSLAVDSAKLERMVLEAHKSPETKKYLATDLFLKGNMALIDGDYQTASSLFKHLVDLVPDEEFIQKKYAVSLIKMGDLQASQLVLEKLYDQGQEEKVGLILAGVYSGLDKEQQARSIYRRILKKNPASEDACVFLGKSYALSKEMTKAITLLNNCSKNDPKNGMYDYYVGKIHVDSGRMNAAMESFKKSYRRQPSLNQAVSAMGIMYEESEQYNSAIALYKKHLKFDPTDSAILSRVVQVLFQQEKYEEVLPYAERLSDLEPENLNLKVKLGILYSDVKKYPEALSIFKELLSFAPDSDKVLYYLGAIHQEMDQFQESIEYFNKIPESSALFADSSVQVANMLSTLALNDSKWKDSFLAHVNRSIEKLKDLRVEFSVIKSGFFESKGQTKEAMECMMVVQNEQGFTTQHKYYLANLFEKEKKFAESTELIMGIIRAEPKNAHAWNFLGYAMLLRGGEMDKAHEYIQTALKISPDDGYIRDSLGWYYYKKGEMQRALAELELAFKKVPDDLEILRHLAVIHKELKNFPKARNFLESALKYAKDPLERESILVTIDELEKTRLPASQEVD
jgi:tetratricopeptide (TPR) repeat protein